GGRDALLRAQILHEALRAFERGRRRTRPERGDALAFERIDQPADKRRLWPDDDKIDRTLLAELDDAFGVTRGNRDALGVFGDAGIARRAVEPVNQGRRGDRPDERVLAPARPDDKDPHRASLPAPVICADERS